MVKFPEFLFIGSKFGPTLEEALEACRICIMRGLVIVICYKLIRVVMKQDKMTEDCDACGRRDKCVQNLGRKSEQKRFIDKGKC
jgi:hypothetical protein